MKRFDRLFIGFPIGFTFWDKIKAVYWRLRNCDHDTGAFLDVGDEDHQVWYCFRCARGI